MTRGRPGLRAAVAVAFAACVAASAALTPVHAATPWYQVEVVVFAQGGEAAWERGDWREAGPPPIAGNTVELLAGLSPADTAGATGRRHAFRALPESALDLGEAVNRLARAAGYRVLLHVGWHQPGVREDDARAVHLGTSRGLVLPGRFAPAAGESVDGTIRMWRRRFVHVEADLAFGAIDAWREREERDAGREAAPPAQTPPPGDAAPRVGEAAPGRPRTFAPAEPDAPRDRAPEAARAPAVAGAGEPPAARAGESGPLRVTRLRRVLRLRAGRIHYLDHPLFGVLLLVKRLA